MGLRTDLLKTAERLAQHALEAPTADAARDYAAGAKSALEAAQLADDIGPGAIEAALASIQELLAEAGVLDEAMELPPAEFLDRAFRSLLAWRREVLAAQGYEVAYDGLSRFAARLERDFLAGDTDTSRRIAGRIRTTLDEVDQIIKHAKGAPDAGSAEK